MLIHFHCSVERALCLIRHRRAPLAYSPEGVWEASGLEVGTVAGFLHENALHFVDDNAIADAAEVAQALGDAGAPLPPLSRTVLL